MKPILNTSEERVLDLQLKERQLRIKLFKLELRPKRPEDYTMVKEELDKTMIAMKSLCMDECEV